MQITDVIIQAQSGDKAARNKLVESNIGLVWSIVKRYMGRGYEADDLFQIGSIGLIKAIDRFDVSYEVMFSTYAIPMIQGEIKRFIRDDGMVKVSRAAKENNWKIKKQINDFESEHAREPTIEELAKVTNLSKDDILLAMEADVCVDSINRKLYENDGRDVCIADNIKDNNDEMNKFIDLRMIQQMMDKLNEYDRRIIELRYFEDKTQAQIAQIYGISQVQVSRLEKKIIKKMNIIANS